MERTTHLRVLSAGRQNSRLAAGTAQRTARHTALPHAVRRLPARTVIARPPGVVLGPDIAEALGSSTESVSLALAAGLALAAPAAFSLARNTSYVTHTCRA